MPRKRKTDGPFRPQRWMVEHAKVEPGPVLAEHQGWRLHQKRRGQEWLNFVLVAPTTNEEKRKYHGAWNGERLAGHPDMGTLQTHYPGMFAWLTAVLASWHRSSSMWMEQR